MNCNEYNSNGTCSLCNQGYVVDSNGNCQITFLKNCIKIDVNGNCNQCISKYVTSPY